MHFKAVSREILQQVRNEITFAENEREVNRHTSKVEREAHKVKSPADFNARDLVFYFKQCAEKSGGKYSISLFKDLGIMKRILNEGYLPTEICTMIDFLFSGKCTYVKNPSINTLGSRFINSLYPDSKDWLNGNYPPPKIRRGKIEDDVKKEEVYIKY